MDTGSILGLPEVRPALLDDVSSTRPAEAEACRGAHFMTPARAAAARLEEPPDWLADDNDDDLDDEFDEDDEDEDKDDDEDDEEEDGEEPETWQVRGVDLR